MVVRAPTIVHSPPTPSNKIADPMLTPLVVIVWPAAVDLKVTAPTFPHTVAATNDIDPLIPSVGAVPSAKVTVPADTVMFRQDRAPVIVTV